MHQLSMPYKTGGQSDTALQHIPTYATFSSTQCLNSIMFSVLFLQILLSFYRNHCRRAGPRGDDISKRPAWVQPSKCAAHPWQPLQWDHVTQAQLIAFENGLRGTLPGPRATDQQPSQPCRMVAWENKEHPVAGSRQAAYHHQQQQQQQQHGQLSHKLSHNPRQDSHAGLHALAGALPAGIPKTETARVSGSRCSSSPVVRHSTQGYAALHKPQQEGAAASPSTRQHSPMQHPSRGSQKDQSARKQESSADVSCSHKSKGASDRPDVHRDTRMSPQMVCTPPRPGTTGASSSPGRSGPNKALVFPSKVKSAHAGGCSPQPVSAHGNAQPAALDHASSQQKMQHKRGLSAHMQNWVRWESDQDKVRSPNL